MTIKSDAYYRGKLPPEAYEGVLDQKVDAPVKDDFVRYRIIYPNGKIIEDVGLEELRERGLRATTAREAVAIENDGTIVQYVFDETGYKDARSTLAQQTVTLIKVFEDDLREENLSNHVAPAVHHTIFSRAWEDGHSGGFSEVASYYQKYVEFAEEILKVSANGK